MAIKKDKAGLSVREETMGRLYALRAGLSTVAREKEIADSIMQQAENAKKNKISNADIRIKNAENNLEQLKKNKYSTERDRGYLYRKAESQSLFVRILAYSFIVFMWLLAISPLGYGAAHICCFCGFFGKNWDKNPMLDALFTWTMFNTFLSIVVFIAATVILIIIARRVTRKIKMQFTYSYSDRKKAKRQIADYDNRIKMQEKSIANAQESIEKAKRQKIIDIQAADMHIAKEKKKATEHAIAGLAVLKAVEESFSDMVDKRDWENIDVMLYALETRRAENMKEALSFVDSERRTAQIVSSVKVAAKEIGKSINGGLHHLQGTMTQQFQKLGDAVVRQGDMVAGRIKELDSKVDDNSNYVQQLGSQVSLNNALREKANENMAAIASEIREYRMDRLTYGGTY